MTAQQGHPEQVSTAADVSAEQPPEDGDRIREDRPERFAAREVPGVDAREGSQDWMRYGDHYKIVKGIRTRAATKLAEVEQRAERAEKRARSAEVSLNDWHAEVERLRKLNRQRGA
jgi:hypothetical protein